MSEAARPISDPVGWNDRSRRVHDWRDIAYRVVAAIFAVLVAPIARIRLHQMERATTDNGIVVCNHRSLFDVVLALVAFRRVGRYPRLAVAIEYFARRGAGLGLRLAGAVPIDRHNPAGTVDRLLEVVAAGTPIIVLAEGKLFYDPQRPASTGPFKTGAARVAHASGLPIWPMALCGTEHIWPPERTLPRLMMRRVDLHLLGSPELFWTTGDARADTDRVQAEVERLLAQLVGGQSSSASSVAS